MPHEERHHKNTKKMSKFSARAQIEGMEIGQMLEFASTDLAMSSLSYYASRLGKLLGRQYMCRSDRSRGISTIRRVA